MSSDSRLFSALLLSILAVAASSFFPFKFFISSGPSSYPYPPLLSLSLVVLWWKIVQFLPRLSKPTSIRVKVGGYILNAALLLLAIRTAAIALDLLAQRVADAARTWQKIPWFWIIFLVLVGMIMISNTPFPIPQVRTG